MSRRNERGIAGTLVFSTLGLATLLFVGGLIASNVFDVALPFSKETADHSPPLILNEIRDLAEFRAGEAEFEVIIDREEDIKWIPEFIAGERVQFVAVGSVDATVDFSAMGDDAVVFDQESNTATVILPAPTYGEAIIDLENSGVMNRDRGVLDRLGGVFSDNPTAEKSLIQEAQRKMESAVDQTDLKQRAEENTTKMLTNLIGALGIDHVRVIYEQPTTPAA